MKTQVIKSDGTCEYVTPKNGTDFTYEELRSFVGGYIEVIHLTTPPDSDNAGKEFLMVVNEEGKIYGLPVNELATRVLLYCSRTANDYIVGDALICELNQIK